MFCCALFWMHLKLGRRDVLILGFDQDLAFTVYTSENMAFQYIPEKKTLYHINMLTITFVIFDTQQSFTIIYSLIRHTKQSYLGFE